MQLEALGLILGEAGAEMEPNRLSPLALAYIGDAVYEMLVRTVVVADGNAPVNRLHQKARDMANAKAQAAFYSRVAKALREDEAAVFRRGRNAKSHTVPKNADLMDYRYATGVEAMFGYWYLSGQMARAVEIFRFGMESKS